MQIRKFMLSCLTVAALAISGFATVSPAQADAFDVVNDIVRHDTGIADFTLDRDEFGAKKLAQLVHLGAEFTAGLVNGYVVAYVPATGEKFIFADAGKGYSEPVQTVAMREQCGPGAFFMQNVGGAIWCTPAHLVGNSGGPTLVGVVPPVERSCTVQVNGAPHAHSC